MTSEAGPSTGSGRPEALEGRRVQFVTGRLAEPALRRVLAEMAKKEKAAPSPSLPVLQAGAADAE